VINRKILILCLVIISAAFFLILFQIKTPSKVAPTIVFIGDSMTEYLGNFDELRKYLKHYYPDKKFLLLNYGFSSTNISGTPKCGVCNTIKEREADQDENPCQARPIIPGAV